MQKQHLIVDGRDMGKYPKSDKIKKLAILKGVEVRLVEESDRERAIRLQNQREKRRYNNELSRAAADAQPSLIDGVETVRAYSGRGK
jgi:hypothetical protein